MISIVFLTLKSIHNYYVFVFVAGTTLYLSIKVNHFPVPFRKKCGLTYHFHHSRQQSFLFSFLKIIFVNSSRQIMRQRGAQKLNNI